VAHGIVASCAQQKGRATLHLSRSNSMLLRMAVDWRGLTRGSSAITWEGRHRELLSRAEACQGSFCCMAVSTAPEQHALTKHKEESAPSACCSA
jgi:hypothetical protein